MRKIIASAHVSLDGIMQSPGGAEEDSSGGFDLGGWIWPYSDDKAKATLLSLLGTSARPNDLLLGRKTYDIFSEYWPEADANNPFGDSFNRANKYVLTHNPQPLEWTNSHTLHSIDELEKLKAENGPDIVLWGSSTLYPPLLAANLIDRLNLLIYPILLGQGKRLFGGTSHPIALKLAGSEATQSGILIAQYEREEHTSPSV